MAQVAHGDGRCPVPGNIQGFEQPGPMESVPAYSKGAGLEGL